ncbi:MAG: hypothetical protein VB977_14695, partial [Pseudohongiellaceae bacterium]
MLCSFWFLSFCVYAQETETGILASWLALDAPTGHEYLATDTIQQRYAGWQRDRYGNLIKEIGNGEPRRIVACGLDSYAYAVSQITDAGYLRLHRIGSGSRHPLWDQAHEGQQLRILTRGGPLLGVSAIANGHFASQHRGETAIVTQDDLWLDVGAESADEVLAMGIALLDPVLRNIPPWHYATEIAGPRAGARVGCAAVFAAAEAGINGAGGSTRYVLSVQQVFGWVGLGAAISSALAPKQLVIVGPGEPEFRNEEVTQLNARANVVINDSTRANMRFIAPRVTDPDALMERIEMSATNEVLAAIVEAVNPDAELPPWLPAPVRAEVLNGESGRWGQHQDTRRMIEVESILDRVAERSAVPGHEGPIRNIVYNLLPGWAKEVAQVDEMGNMWVEFGPGGEATVFIAHMDEVGYAVESIAANGVLGLTRLGGVVNTAWEGQPALLQLDPNTDLQFLAEAPQLRGIFLGRSEPDQKRPDSVQAWFGMNAEQLADAGVEIGMG